jgi:hypothetical protein
MLDYTMLAFAGFVDWTPASSQIEHLDLCSTPRPQHLVTLLSSFIGSEILQDLFCVSFAFAVCLFPCGCDHSFVAAGLWVWWWSDRQVAWSMCTIFILNLIAWRRTCHIGTKASEEIYTDSAWVEHVVACVMSTSRLGYHSESLCGAAIGSEDSSPRNLSPTHTHFKVVCLPVRFRVLKHQIWYGIISCTTGSEFVGVSHKHAWSKGLFDPSKGLAKKRGPDLYCFSFCFSNRQHIANRTE